MSLSTNDYHKEQWSTIIQPKKGWLELGLKEIVQYRDLIGLFVMRDFVALYKQTILGPLWFLLQPLFNTIVFLLIFSTVAKISTDGIPAILFYLSGIILWNYFSTCLTNTSSTFTANTAIFGKVYFPRLVVPISIILSNLLAFAIQSVLFLFVFLYYYLSSDITKPNIWILFTPILIVQMAILGMGFGILISSLTTKYRDLTFVLGFGVQLWMYATPIVYPLSQVPQSWKPLFLLNPMASIVEMFRFALFGAGSINLGQFVQSFGISVFILILGIILFNRVEKTFMDTI